MCRLLGCSYNFLFTSRSFSKTDNSKGKVCCQCSSQMVICQDFQYAILQSAIRTSKLLNVLVDYSLAHPLSLEFLVLVLFNNFDSRSLQLYLYWLLLCRCQEHIGGDILGHIFLCLCSLQLLQLFYHLLLPQPGRCSHPDQPSMLRIWRRGDHEAIMKDPCKHQKGLIEMFIDVNRLSGFPVPDNLCSWLKSCGLREYITVLGD